MNGFSHSPKLTKAALVAIDPDNPLASVIIFQYNPERLSRTLQTRAATRDGAAEEILRLQGAPKETISVSELVLDAADQLEKGDPQAGQLGIHPQLATLEMLLYPRSRHVIANTALLQTGAMEVLPPEAPLTLFVWGVKRVVPVQITGFSVSETFYDPRLNPVHATLNLDMTVLTYSDFPLEHTGRHLFMAHQIAKEAMAVVGSVEGISAAGLESIGI
ncbi:MAG TPA: hypothetical protein ENI90_09455 [Methylothermaceae bacterium]|nr:hypothetical protein [Methylothermaceae bacterium]